MNVPGALDFVVWNEIYLLKNSSVQVGFGLYKIVEIDGMYLSNNLVHTHVLSFSDLFLEAHCAHISMLCRRSMQSSAPTLKEIMVLNYMCGLLPEEAGTRQFISRLCNRDQLIFCFAM